MVAADVVDDHWHQREDDSEDKTRGAVRLRMSRL